LAINHHRTDLGVSFDGAEVAGFHAFRLVAVSANNWVVDAACLIFYNLQQGSGWVHFIVVLERAKQLAGSAADAGSRVGY
jgi:hypothetical protein